MAITYEPMAPVGIAAGIARMNGGGGGVSLAEQYAAEMQAKSQAGAEQARLMQQDRQFQDSQREQQSQFEGNRTYSPRDAGIASAQMAQQQQAVALRAQQNSEELSQGEGIRLQRLKQGEDEVKRQLAGGTLSEDEANASLMKLRSNINPLEMKLAASQLKHQDMQNQQIKQSIEVQSAAETRRQKDAEAHLQYSAATLAGKVQQIPDGTAVNDAAKAIKADFPDMPDEQVMAAAKEEAIRQGKFSTWYPDSKGVPTHAKGVDEVRAAGDEGAGAGAGKSRSRGGAGGPKEFDPTAAMKEAIHIVSKGVADGTIKPEEAEAREQKIYEKLKGVHHAYNDELAGTKAAGKPAPFRPGDQSSGTDEQRGQVVKIRSLFDDLAKSGLPPDQMFKASQAINKVIELTGRYADSSGSMEHAPAHVKQGLAALNKQIAAALGKGTVAPPAGETREQVLERLMKAAEYNRQGDAAARAGAPAPAAAPPGQPLPAGAGLIPDLKRGAAWVGERAPAVPTKEQLRKTVPPPLMRLGDYLRTY